MEKEIWKPVKNTNDNYLISNLGNVRSRHNKYTHKIDNYKLLNPYKSKKGYLVVKIKELGTSRPVHRLVAEAFINNDNNLPQVNHINGIKTDNRVDNLEWCNNQYNTKQAIVMGLCNKRIEKTRKPINQYDLEHNFIKKWNSIEEAKNTLNILHISEVCNKSRKSAGGYIWEFINDRNS